MHNSFPTRIAYFITGHGFGHAVRSVQLINALPQVSFTIITTIDRKYFEREINDNFDYLFFELDCGVSQTNAIEVDISATYEHYQLIDNLRGSKIEECKKYLIEKNIQFIISDIVPLAFTIASQLQLPSLAISNFTWVEIYKEYIGKEPRFKSLISIIKQDYSNASSYAKLYPGIEAHPFKQCTEMSLLCRSEARNKNWLFNTLKIDTSKKLCLIYIGQFGLENTHWDNLSTYKDWVFIGIYPLKDAPDNYIQINLNQTPIKYSDIIANSDLIIGKLGYGTVSECLYWKKPIAYPPRKHFCEYSALEKSVQENNIGAPLSLEQLHDCNLTDILEWAQNTNLNHLNYTTAQESLINLIQHIFESHHIKDNN